jgi:chitin synthase
MQPGEIFNPNHPQNRRENDPYSPNRSAFPPSTTYPFPNPQGQMTNPYDNPPPAQHQFPPLHQQQNVPHSQSTSFPAAPYADPFRAQDNGAQQGYADPPASRHYASYPNFPSSPPAGPRPPSAAPYNLPQQSLSPAPHRTRFDSNVSYLSAQSLAPSSTSPYPYGLADQRLTSPPPLLPAHSSSSDVGFAGGYPPRASTASIQAGLNQGYSSHHLGVGNDDDFNDSSPLINHATPDARFGIPQSQSAMSLRPTYQLSDRGSTPQPHVGYQDGDVGLGPGRWDDGYGNGHLPGAQEDDDGDNVHYGPVPARMVRRNRTQKRVQ